MNILKSGGTLFLAHEVRMGRANVVARPTQYCHHPNIDPPLPDVLGQSLSLAWGQLEDWAEWRMGQEDR